MCVGVGVCVCVCVCRLCTVSCETSSSRGGPQTGELTDSMWAVKVVAKTICCVRVQAVYCETPFFTWRAPNGTGNGLHVGVHELLYRELVPLIDSTARSVEFLTEHLKKVRNYNANL